MALIDNLVSYHKLDESSGDALDVVASSTLTETNGAIGSVGGKIGNARNLASASSQYFNRTSAIITALPFTIAGWIQLASTGAAKVIASLGDSTLSNVALLQISASDKLQLYCEKAGIVAANFSGTTSFTTGVWYHIAGVFSSTDFRTYVNGSLEASDSTTLVWLLPPDRTSIGTRIYAGTPADYWDGYLDEIGYWSRALSGAEITSLYNGGAGLAYPFGVGNPYYYQHLACSGSGMNV